MKSITKFNESMMRDLRLGKGCAAHRHFRDFPDRLVPLTSAVDNVPSGFYGTGGVDRFTSCWNSSAAETQLFGLSVDGTSGSAAKVFKRPYTSTTWATLGTFASSSMRILAEYNSTLFTVLQNGEVRSIGPTTGTVSSSYGTITTPTHVTPVHHTRTDYLYFFSETGVYALNGSTWIGLSFTATANAAYTITAACQYQDWLAIGVSPKSEDKKSFVILWNLDSGTVTFDARIEAGAGPIKHLGVINDELIGITTERDAFGYSSLVARRFTGRQSEILNTLEGTALTEYMDTCSYNDGQYLYFTARQSSQVTGSDNYGIWSVDNRGNMRVAVTDSTANTTTNTWGGGFTRYMGSWIYRLNLKVRTQPLPFNGSAVYTENAIFDTAIIGPRTVKEDINSISVTTEALSSGQSVNLYWKKSYDTTWTPIGTHNSLNGKIKSFTGKTASGGIWKTPTEEYQLRIESVGGAVVTGLYWTPEINSNQPAI